MFNDYFFTSWGYVMEKDLIFECLLITQYTYSSSTCITKPSLRRIYPLQLDKPCIHVPYKNDDSNDLHESWYAFFLFIYYFPPLGANEGFPEDEGGMKDSKIKVVKSLGRKLVSTVRPFPDSLDFRHFFLSEIRILKNINGT